MKDFIIDTLIIAAGISVLELIFSWIRGRRRQKRFEEREKEKEYNYTPRYKKCQECCLVSFAKDVNEEGLCLICAGKKENLARSSNSGLGNKIK